MGQNQNPAKREEAEPDNDRGKEIEDEHRLGTMLSVVQRGLRFVGFFFEGVADKQFNCAAKRSSIEGRVFSNIIFNSGKQFEQTERINQLAIDHLLNVTQIELRDLARSWREPGRNNRSVER